MKNIWKSAIITVVVLITIPLLFFILVYSGAFGHIQSVEELRNFRNAEASEVLSSEGLLIGKFYTENRTNITYEQLPSHLINALVATEDARFFEHQGVDSRSLVRVLLKTILLNRSESGGGSTITQQLAKNMFGRKGNGRLSIFVNKYREAIIAGRLEKTFRKEEILTLYLNTVSFGENIYGIETAASRYFNKITEKLRLEESAMLIGMLKATTRYNPALNPEKALTRRNVVLKQMEKYNYLEPDAADSLSGLPLSLSYRKTESEGSADYFLVQVKREAEEILNNIAASHGKTWDIEKDGLIITTTLNLTLQNFARRLFADHLAIMQKHFRDQYSSPSGRKQVTGLTEAILDEKNLSHKADEKRRQVIFDWKGTYTDSVSIRDSIKRALTTLHAGLLALDPQNGAVRAWVGGIDFTTHPYDQILARRQLGSVFKPILYALAFEEGIEPCHYLDNDSLVLSEYKDWSPENFDHSYGGKYSLAGALARSMNIPTFNLFLELGFERLDSLWREMGFSFQLDNTPSLPLGTAEANMAEVAVAYSAFANGGYKVRPWSVASIITPGGDIIYHHDPDLVFPKVLTERSCLLISAILQKAVNEGTGSSMRTAYGVNSPFAGKTGTSQNYADSWFAAYNPKLVILARAGASSPAIHFNSPAFGTGSALALPLVAMTLRKTESFPETAGEFITQFPVLPAELAEALDCPDFKEDGFLDKLMDILKKSEIDNFYKTERKKRSFLERLFRRKIPD